MKIKSIITILRSGKNGPVINKGGSKIISKHAKLFKYKFIFIFNN